MELHSQDRVMVCRQELEKIKSREIKQIITQLRLDLETSDRLNNMVMDVLEL
jgi:hypothetical protein